MERPTEHGGGVPGPAIAGDPGSFPADAELARTLVAGARQATLCTLTADGYPYGSAVSYAADEAGAPLLLISELAEHTVNARADDRVSMLVTAPAARQADPLGISYAADEAGAPLLADLGVGRAHGERPRRRPREHAGHGTGGAPGRSPRQCPPHPARPPAPGRRSCWCAPRASYLERHPYAAAYVDFSDFSFWRLGAEKCRFVGGFGHMSWVAAEDYRDAAVDPLAGDAAAIIGHMNEDHADANLQYVTALAGLDDAGAATMVGLDHYGVTLRADTPGGPRLARIRFPEPLQRADQARATLIRLLQQAREQDARKNA